MECQKMWRLINDTIEGKLAYSIMREQVKFTEVVERLNNLSLEGLDLQKFLKALCILYRIHFVEHLRIWTENRQEKPSDRREIEDINRYINEMLPELSKLSYEELVKKIKEMALYKRHYGADVNVLDIDDIKAFKYILRIREDTNITIWTHKMIINSLEMLELVVSEKEISTCIDGLTIVRSIYELRGIRENKYVKFLFMELIKKHYRLYNSQFAKQIDSFVKFGARKDKIYEEYRASEYELYEQYKQAYQYINDLKPYYKISKTLYKEVLYEKDAIQEKRKMQREIHLSEEKEITQKLGLLQMPELKITEDIRKFERHSKNKRVEVVYDYLFNGHSNRWIDEHILGQDSSYTRGWNSMAILHHLGLVDVHKGIFKEQTLEQAIEVLEQQDSEVFKTIIEMLRKKIYSYAHVGAIAEQPSQYGVRTMEEVERELEQETKVSKGLTKKERSKRLRNALRIPKMLTVITTTYQRNPHVVAEVLERANGVCERCGVVAPFIRASDGTPYLEVHHKARLADGGEDTVENAIAVCPNCHRELHYGARVRN